MTTTSTATTPTGVVSTSAGASYITGTVSGLNTDALISAAVAQQTARADTIDTQVTANTTKISSYTTLQGLLNDVSTAISTLAGTTYSALSDTTNAFGEKQAYLTASDGADATTILAVSATSTAVAASYTVTIDQLAKAMKVAGTAQDATTTLAAGSFTLGVEGGQAATIDITDGMSINDLANAINAQTTTSGVAATVVNSAGSGGAATYQLILSAADTDKAIITTPLSGQDLMTSLGVTTATGGFANVLQAAQPAMITIDGIPVSGATNDFTNTVGGLSLSLLQTTAPGQSVTLDIKPNYTDVKTAVTGFVTAYNALRTFVATNQTVGADGTVSADAVLFADSLLRGVSSSLGSLVGNTTASASGGVATLADLGITIDSSNNLVLSDETTLDNLLLDNFSSLSSFFQTSFTSSDSSLKLMANTSTASMDFSLQVTAGADGVITDVTANGQEGMFTISGGLLVGAKGTPYAGLSFAVAPQSGVSTMSVSVKQGFANQVATLMNTYANTSTGLIQNQISSLTTTDTSLTTTADKIRADAETYRQKLVTKYATMETELYAAQVMQQQLQAILGATSATTN